MKYFWTNRNRITMGSMEKVDAAMSWLYRVPTSELKLANPTGRVLTSGLLVTINTHRKAFQLPINFKSDPVMITGFDRGTIIRHKNPHFEIPSIFPASYNSSGILIKCCRIRNMTNTLTVQGTIKA